MKLGYGKARMAECQTPAIRDVAAIGHGGAGRAALTGPAFFAAGTSTAN